MAFILSHPAASRVTTDESGEAPPPPFRDGAREHFQIWDRGCRYPSHHYAKVGVFSCLFCVVAGSLSHARRRLGESCRLLPECPPRHAALVSCPTPHQARRGGEKRDDSFVG